MRQAQPPAKRTRGASGDERAIALIEFAFALPVILVLMLLLSDAVALGRGYLRVQNAAQQIGQIVSQCERITAADEANLLTLTARMIGRLADNGEYRLIINTWGRDGENAAFTLTRTDRSGTGAGTLTVSSKGTETPTTFGSNPDTFTPGRNTALMRTEVFVRLDRTTLSRMLPYLATRGVTFGYETGRGEAVHVSRLQTVDTLKTRTGTSCL